ncbi:LOW QUALITY PROTEIN: thymidine phosphorylase [Aplochiton taeniatus]
MSFPELIRKKRDGGHLSAGEIRRIIEGVKVRTIQDSQIGAFLMAVWQQGMGEDEIDALTREMMMSGEVISWPAQWKGLVVDKHSTGGVGDKVSLVLAPALAACGCKVPMISGRGLAHTGGTLDKLEAIPGFSVQQPVSKLHRVLEEVGCCIVGQTESLVPAIRVLYALRDATATVDSLPLITGSIISKKGAESLDALVLDVKFGRAALYRDLESAKTLAHSLVTLNRASGICTGAVLSRMDSPIGCCVGNSLEVIEALETLKGRGHKDLLELVHSLGGVLLKMCGKVSTLSEGHKAISEAVISGAALSKFQAMMVAQGVANHIAGSLCSTQTDYYSILGRAHSQTELESEAQGTVVDIDGMVLAKVLHNLGAGRSKAGEPINHRVGAELLVSIGQHVDRGDCWLRVHYESPALSPHQRFLLQNALTIGTSQTQTHNLVAELILP